MCFLRKFVLKIHLPPLLKYIPLIDKGAFDFVIKLRNKFRCKYPQHYKITVGGFLSAYKVFGLVEDSINGLPFGLLPLPKIGHTVIIIIKKRS